jgi:hypothetical protein
VHEGWLVLAQPINDFGQYQSGRDVGIPKYMADMSIEQTDTGWRQSAVNMATTADQSARPGAETGEGTDLVIDWHASAPEATEEQVADNERWVIFGGPLLGHDAPFDEVDGPGAPALTKFTPSAYVPATSTLAITPFTQGPWIEMGTATVTLDGIIPVVGVPWSDLVGSEQLTDVPAAYAQINGALYMTFDGLENNLAD